MEANAAPAAQPIAKTEQKPESISAGIPPIKARPGPKPRAGK